jgi:hypothetical protein
MSQTDITLMVPIKIDCLSVNEPLLVAEASADFSRLPYFDGESDVNSDTAFISEDIVSQPLSDLSNYLPTGLHLHWTLPFPLTQGDANGDQMQFPYVPDRWLITRTAKSNGEIRRWIVESDFLFPHNMENAPWAVTFPSPTYAKENNEPPFHYIGRTIQFDDWVNEGNKRNKYLKTLTAVGYGDPTFAAFYPNCFSLFGFHDAKPLSDGATYSVAGWYAQDRSDFCAQSRFQQFIDLNLHNEDAIAQLQEQFRWTIDLEQQKWVDPNRLVCYGQIQIGAKSLTENGRIPSSKDDVSLAIGNTATEALSTLLAIEQEMAIADQRKLEEQLESLNLMGELEQHHIDIGAKFLEARHSKGFHSVDGGTIWTIKPVDPGGGKAVAERVEAEITLDPELSHLLNQLNLVQQKRDSHRFHIESMRVRIFSDWYKYMQAAYPSETGVFAEIDIDAIRLYIEVEIELLGELEAELGGNALSTSALQTQINRCLVNMQKLDQEDIVDWTGLARELKSKQGNAWKQLMQWGEFYNAVDQLVGLQASTGPQHEAREKPVAGDVVLKFWVAHLDWLQALKLKDRSVTKCIALLNKFKDGKTTPEEVKTLREALFSAELGQTVQRSLENLIFDELQKWVSGPSLLDNPGFASASANDLVKRIQREEEFTPATKKLIQQGHLPGDLIEIVRSDRQLKRKENVLRLNRLILQSHLPTVKRRSNYALNQIPGPRYWEPNEPVILIKGDGIAPTNRYQPHHYAKCTVHSGLLGHQDKQPRNVKIAQSLEKAIAGASQDDDPVQLTQTEQPWHPFLLEWETNLYPNGGVRSNIHPAKRAYASDFITASYQLEEQKIDLVFQKDGDQTRGTASSVYSGRSILTPGAKFSLAQSIEGYLDKHLSAEYIAAHPDIKTKLADDQQAHLFYETNRDAIIDWYHKTPTAQDPFTTKVLQIESIVNDDKNPLYIQAQTLTGLNSALLGHKLTMQLPIADPLADRDPALGYQAFAQKVKQAVGNFNRIAPQPTNDFHPIRTGHLQITTLRVIDTFGQVCDLGFSGIYAADGLTLDNSKEPSKIQLPPRLVQPARLNFRWLANGHGPGHMTDETRDDAEMNSHPATTPICGWLVANNLNKTILFYNVAGQALGYFDKNCVWRKEPGGRSTTEAVDQIQNPHLRRVALWLEKQGAAFLSDFRVALDLAQESMNPANFAQHLDTAILMGRPIAVTRTSLSLQHKGLPPLNQDGTVFRNTLKTGRGETDKVEFVEFPVRLGEHGQLNDGLLGYWVEQHSDADHANVTLSDTFISPQRQNSKNKGKVANEKIVTWESESNKPNPQLNTYLSLNETPKVFTMLVDPRGAVHATSGILPTKQIDIPPDQFKTALSQIEVSFLSTPILTEDRPDELDLPLPVENGYGWFWSEAESDHGWNNARQIKEVNTQAHHVGSQIIRDGWLVLRPQSSNENSRQTGDRDE